MDLRKFQRRLTLGAKTVKWIYYSLQSPSLTLLKIFLVKPPFSVTLVSGKEVTIKSDRKRVDYLNDKYEIVHQMMSKAVTVSNKPEFFYNRGRNIFRIVDFNNLDTILETFFFESWKKLKVKNKAVLDVGGYVGDTAIYYAARGAKRVISYEPFPFSFEIEVRNINENGLVDKISVVNRAVGGRDSRIFLDETYVNNNASEAISLQEGREVKVDSLDSIVSRYGIQNWSLKMNCEGCEYEVFKNCELRTLEAFDEILMHYHGDPAPLVQKLTKAGFKVEVQDLIHAKKRATVIKRKFHAF